MQLSEHAGGDNGNKKEKKKMTKEKKKQKEEKKKKKEEKKKKNERSKSKSMACQHQADKEGVTLEADLGELRAPDAATELADHPKAEAAGEQQPGDTVPAEPSIEQPMDPNADRGATEADAMEGTPSAGACKSGQLYSTPPPPPWCRNGTSAGLAITVRSNMAPEAHSLAL